MTADRAPRTGQARSGTRGVPREVRTAAILEAAAAEFGDVGYAAAQVTAIAARADVSKALVLAYFGSKDKLYVACVQQAGPIVFDAVRAAFDTAPAERPGMSLFSRAASAVLTSIFTALEGRTGYWALLYDRSVPEGAGRDVARAERRRLREQAATEVAGVMRAAGLTAPTDITVAVLVWESMVSANMQFWRLNPHLSAAEVSAAADRVLAAWSVQAPQDPTETENP
ncbi:TetR/AcrR family transcriptional regulator [Tsukamurella sp. 1534]|uniref:TetR/AcrR family transcriptional regulator n=1 Tax=Tsukamurella sp. 1534 TaxID=1151061 RepID=UPI000306551D|nr:TetR/AcrR family transcriptional regulator [Tsukamurella sp. 1534]